MFGGVIVYVSAEAKAYKNQVKAIARGIKPSNKPFRLDITLCPKRNKDGSTSKVCVDLDNTLKVTLDALNGVVWFDDKQVEEITVRKGESCLNGGLTVSYEEINRC